MAYTKGYPLWKDDPDHTTPIVATKLNNFEDGIANAHGLIATLDGETDAAVAAEAAARVAGDNAAQAAINTHIIDPTGAHEAEAISVSPTNPVGSDDVDEALRDLYAAIVGGGMPSTIIDAKGDLIVGAEDDLPTKLPVGANDEVLTADDAAPFGLAWKEAVSQEQIDNIIALAIPKLIINEEGDLIVGAAPDTPQILPVGANGDVLTVDDTVGNKLKWAPAEASGGGVDYKGAYVPATAYEQGDVVVYEGREYVAVNPSTGQTPVAAPPPAGSLPVLAYGTTLPASPFDGQQAILVDSLTAPTYSWLFRYVAAKASNKWVFLGGAPLFSESNNAEATTSATYVSLTTAGPTVTPPVTGEYLVALGCVALASATASTAWMSFSIGATAAVDSDGTSVLIHGTREGVLMREERKGALAAGAALLARYRSDGTNSFTFKNRWMRLTPVAVGG